MLVLAGLAGVAGATHYQPAGNMNCTHADMVHAYGAPAGVIVDSRSLDVRRGLAPAMVFDGNVEDCFWDGVHPEYGDGILKDYDGDTEFGVNGGRFAGGDYFAGCSDYGVSHHPHGSGTEYWAADNSVAADIFFTVGTDGPVIAHDPLDPSMWCVTNDVISADPLADPADCPGNLGSNGPTFGLAKSRIGGRNTPAGPNDATSLVTASVTTCHGYDGFVWFFLWTGVFEDDGNIYISTPTTGDILH